MEPLVALFQGLRRGVPQERVDALVDAALGETPGPDRVADVVVLAMHARWCRGGKGERDAGLRALASLHRHYPDTVRAVLPLLSTFGTWKDLLQLGSYVPCLQDDVCDVYARQLLADDAGVSRPRGFWARLLAWWHALWRRTPHSVSLAGKYMPAQHGHFDKAWGAARSIRLKLEVQSREAWPPSRYRRLKAFLCARLDLIEGKLCQHRRDAIEFDKVPSRSMARYAATLLNTAKHADSARMACAARFEAWLENPRARLHGKGCFPDELVHTVLRHMHMRVAPAEVLVANAQWRGLRADLARQLRAAGEPPAVACMVDVSGSMTGKPIEVSISMGLLVADLTQGVYRGRVMTFDTDVQWHDVDTRAPLHEQVRALAMAPWGGSTDFRRAMSLLLHETRKGVPVPDRLLVVSDMHFNEASGQAAPHWPLLWAEISVAFAVLQSRPPEIYFWNVAASENGVDETADIPGVVLLNGFSQAFVKFVLSRTDVAAPAAPPRQSTSDLVASVLAHPDLARVRDAALQSHSAAA